MANSSLIKRMVISIVLLMVAANLLLQGQWVDGSQYREITRAVYYVGAAIVVAIALIPWAKE